MYKFKDDLDNYFIDIKDANHKKYSASLTDIDELFLYF